VVLYICTAVVLNVASAAILHLPRSRTDKRWLLAACVCAFIGVFLEKGLGLIIPGFVPSTLHEMVEYTPTLLEWKVSAGIWALGLMVLTVALKVGLSVWSGRLVATTPSAASDA
jgi:molybdopterin-containing oxidoreductase family membrane subunit